MPRMQGRGYDRGIGAVSYTHLKSQVMKSMAYAYAGRKAKKRDFRKLWIARINAAARMNGISYSRMMDGLKKSGIQINRKILAEMAVSDPAAFAKLAEAAKAQLGA